MAERNTTPWTQRPRDTADVEPVLEVVCGAARGRRYTLDKAQMIIGREGDIELADTGVSRRHAKVIVAADRSVMIMDLGSRNGTLVNGTNVSLATLVVGDRIKIGPSAELQLTLGQPDPEPPLLSERQLEVARLVADGLSNAAVARALGISPNTVARHLENIYARVGVRTRTALAAWLRKR